MTLGREKYMLQEKRHSGSAVPCISRCSLRSIFRLMPELIGRALPPRSQFHP